MSFKINVNYLSRDELEYELSIRGLETAGKVEDLRKLFRPIINLEKHNASMIEHSNIPDFPEEVQVIKAKLKEVREKIPATRKAEVIKLETKVAHLYRRTNNLSANDDDELAAKSKLTTELLTLATILTESTEQLKTDLPELELYSKPSTSQSQSTSTPVPNTLIPSPGAILPVKWNLKFSGEPSTISINAFLEKVHELSQARNVDEAQLFMSAYDLFEGKAAHWYRANKKYAGCWTELEKLLKDEFQPPDYNIRLFDEIKKRTQGRDETIGVYVAIMETLFNRLSANISEETKLNILLKNITPFYQTNLGLVEVNSIKDLVIFCRKLEAKRNAVDNFVPPSRKRTDLEPDLAYVDTYVPEQTLPSSEVSAITSPGITCWNCREKGHSSRQCKAPKRKYCYRCGQENFTVLTCPKCKSGNDRSRHQ